MKAIPNNGPGVRWIEPEPTPVPDELLNLTGGQPLLAEVLFRRGFANAEKARPFLDPSAYCPAPATDLPDLTIAADRLEVAIRKSEMIGVWGDFDVDGQTSTTVLVDTLRSLGGKVSYHVPVRARESHGVNLPGLQAFLESGVQLVLTCDTGITAHDAAIYAKEHGVDFLITDHHSLPPELPQAFAAVNPQRLPLGHPLRGLPGVGTAFKLAEELANRAGRPEIAVRQLDLVALGIIADMAVLTADARYLAQLGLEALRHSRRLAIQTILETADMAASYLTEETIGFVLAPRLNAIGRLDDANPIIEFLTTNDLTKARLIANQLEALNANRRLMCSQVLKAAQEQIERNPSLLDHPVLVLSHPTWPAGVVGIVASQLVSLYHRPAILIATPPGEPGRGSARSIEGVNITEAITTTRDLLLGFGGHPMAAGLSIDPQQIAEFRRRLGRSVAVQTQGQNITLNLNIEAFLPLEQVNLNLVEQLDRLAPFGPGNPAPLLAARDLVIKERSFLGRGEDHLLLVVEDPQGNLHQVIWWSGDMGSLPEGRFDLAYSARSSSYRGTQEVQIQYVDIRQQENAALQIPDRLKIQVLDYRFETEPQVILDRLPAKDDLLVWQEGENKSHQPGHDRNDLSHAQSLVIWSIPPSRDVLDTILKKVSPDRVYLFGVYPSTDQSAAFLNRLAGLVRYSLQNLHGQAGLSRLAAATAQRESTVRKGLQWLEARGVIQVIEEADGNLILIGGGKVTPTLQAVREKEIHLLLQETAAFRSYYLRADPDSLIEKTE